MNGIYGPDSLDPDMSMCKNLREQVSVLPNFLVCKFDAIPIESLRCVSSPSAPYNRTKIKQLLTFGGTFLAEDFEI